MKKEEKKVSAEMADPGTQEQIMNGSAANEDPTRPDGEDPSDLDQDEEEIRIQEVMAGRYIGVLQEIAIKFNEWKDKASTFGVSFTPDMIFDVFRLDFKTIREAFDEHVINAFGPGSSIDQKSTFVSSFDAWLEEWHRFMYAKRMGDGEPIDERVRSLFDIDESNDLVLPDESKGYIREMFDAMIQTDKGARVARIQEEIRKNVQDLYDLFNGVRSVDRPFFLQITPASIMRMFVYEEDENSKMKVFAKKIDYDNLFISTI